MDPEDTPGRDSHINEIGLSDCKFVPSVISFPSQDPLGKKSFGPELSAEIARNIQDSTLPAGSSKPLGQQADSLVDSSARLYALERIHRAGQIIVCRKIVLACLEVLVKTLSFEEVRLALVDLGIDNVQVSSYNF